MPCNFLGDSEVFSGEDKHELKLAEEEKHWLEELHVRRTHQSEAVPHGCASGMLGNREVAAVGAASVPT